MTKAVGLLIVGALLLSACTVDECKNLFKEDPTRDTRQYQVKPGDKVVSTIYSPDMLLTVVDPMVSASGSCNNVQMQVMAFTPRGEKMVWNIRYDQLTPVENGANWR